MLQFALPTGGSTTTVVTGSGTGGGPGSDTTAARLTDYRFYGIERIDLRAKYGAPLDGTLHPLSSMGLAAAQSLYPNIGLSTSTNLSTFAQDLAAALQAEYDLRTGNGGIIGGADGGQMVLSGQFWLQNAGKVWFHGGRKFTVLTAGTGTTPAIRVSFAGSSGVPLQDIALQAQAAPVAISDHANGVASTAFTTGASALLIDQTQGIEIKAVTWNGFDAPLQWGDKTWGIVLNQCIGIGNNIGFSWQQTTDLNSGERITADRCSFVNNNKNGKIDGTVSGGSQGLDFYFENCAWDYATELQLEYTGEATGQYESANGVHIIGGHIETAGYCMGTANTWITSQGDLYISDVDFNLNDGNMPPGLIHVADNTAASVRDSRINTDAPLPIFYSTSTASKFVTSSGNRMRAQNVRPVMLKDANGSILQDDITDGQRLLIYGDFATPMPLTNYKKAFVVNNYNGPVTITAPTDAQADWPLGARVQFKNISGQPITFAAQSGAQMEAFPNTSLTISAVGAEAELFKYDHNHWLLLKSPGS